MKQTLLLSKMVIHTIFMLCVASCATNKMRQQQAQKVELYSKTKTSRAVSASAPSTKETKKTATSSPEPEPILNNRQIRVYYATDRKNEGIEQGMLNFSTKRGALVSYGIAQVSIPAHRCIGEMNQPSFWKLEFREDVAKHIIITRSQSIAKTAYFSSLDIAAQKGGSNAGLLFIHGYNVNFQEATRRTAQLACDIGFEGPAMLFSWPSKGGLIPYSADEASIRWSTSHIEQFIENVLDTKNIQNLYIIAHSMGNRGTTDAIIQLLQRRPMLKERIKEIILAAPDIDAGTFVDEIAPKLTQYKKPITLYVSSKDRALIASGTIHRSAQAGDAGNSVIVFPGIETVDASLVSTSLLGHSYIMEERPLLSDLYQLITYGTRAATRHSLYTHSNGRKRYYIVRP